MFTFHLEATGWRRVAPQPDNVVFLSQHSRNGKTVLEYLFVAVAVTTYYLWKYLSLPVPVVELHRGFTPSRIFRTTVFIIHTEATQYRDVFNLKLNVCLPVCVCVCVCFHCLSPFSVFHLFLIDYLYLHIYIHLHLIISFLKIHFTVCS